jgi:hypothetical protein
VVHLRDNGFSVKPTAATDAELNRLKKQYGIPQSLHSCHTAVVGNYVIEGHVPADLIHRLLKEKPAVLGLAVPGMPVGSPGMEGGAPEPYSVYTFDRNAKVQVYAKR